MGRSTLVLLLSFLCLAKGQEDGTYYGTFPDDFIFGTATSAYQTEGAWNIDGKGLNIWDRFTHRDPSPINNGDTGDVACDSYHLYKEDVRAMRDLSVQSYRFSISWARLLPDGTTNVINPAGVEYYNNLIDTLLTNGIEPVVTLYHWDLPQALQEKYGGWVSQLLVEDFGNYARTCFSLFGDRVKLWITLNEPWVQSFGGYGNSVQAPGYHGQGVGEYQAGHVSLMCNARAWHIYNDEFRATQRGKIGITLNFSWLEPKTNSTEDLEASERAKQFKFGWFAHPIFTLPGDYPPIMREIIDRRSADQGFVRSRLPVFSEEWIDYIRGSADFVGLNHYTTNYVEPGEYGLVPSWESDQEVTFSVDPAWPESPTGQKVVPWGLRKLLNWIKNEYGNTAVYITENGCPDYGGLNDTSRVQYYTDYLNEVLKAIDLDGCNVKGYFAWSLVDNFEWGKGFTFKYGLYNVDFNDPARPRTAKESAKTYGDIVRNRGFPAPNKQLTIM